MTEGIPDKASGNDLAVLCMASVSKVVIDQAVEFKGSGNPPLEVTTMGESSSMASVFAFEKATVG
jgi:hypothetical protein